MAAKSSKLLALLLALLIVLSVFMGCDTKKLGIVDEGQPSVIDGDEQGNDVEDHKEEDSEKDAIDLDGYEVRIGSIWEANPRLGPGDRHLSGEFDKIRIYYEEKYNCKIKWIALSEEGFYQKYTAGVLSGNPESDITLMKSQWLPGIMRKGMCYDLTELVDINNERHYRKREIESLGMYNGRIYALYTANMYTLPTTVMLFNKVLLKEKVWGISVP